MGSSSNAIDYSLGQNKAIERSLVVKAVRDLAATLEPTNYIFIGLGSVWFVDFHLFHREMNIRNMISIESDPIVAHRARYNRPYRTVRIEQGTSYDVLQTLYGQTWRSPWIVWLDYDRAMDDDKLVELSELMQKSPVGSFVLTTFSASAGHYGKPAHRRAHLEDLFETSLPADVSDADLRDEMSLSRVLGDLVFRWMTRAAVSGGREGGALKFAQLTYKDGTPMSTVGVHLPTADDRKEVAARVGSGTHAIRPRPILTPILTHKEVAALRSRLPSRRLTRAGVRRMGFDLDDDELRAFVEHYMEFPSFEQVWR